jgi:hypothetical protein
LNAFYFGVSISCGLDMAICILILAYLKIQNGAKCDAYLIFLSNTVSSGLSLQVILRVPIRVEYNNRVSGRQINSQSSSSG